MRFPLVISGAHLLHPYVGVGTYSLRLIRGLAKADGIGFRVLLPREAQEAAALLPPDCFDWVEGRSPSGHGLINNIYWMDRIAARALRDHPGAIFHSPGSFWSWRRPPRLAVTLHDCIYRRFPEYLGRRFLRRRLTYAMEKYAAKARLVLTVSRYSASDLHELAHIPAEKIRVVYPWSEPRFHPAFAAEEAPRVREGYRLPASFFLYVGGYDYRKNVEFLLAAYAAARRQADLPPLVLAGKIPAERAPAQCDVHGTIRAHGLKAGENVLLPGFIADADLPGLYGACHALVYPSLYEGFGYPPVEAVASGRPALVADNSSLREIMPEPRLRFPTDDPAVLAGRLHEVWRSPADFLRAPDPRFTEEYAIAAYLEAVRAAFPG